MARPDRTRYNHAMDPAMLDDPLLPYVVALLVIAAVLAITGVVVMQLNARDRAARDRAARRRAEPELPVQDETGGDAAPADSAGGS